jgi:hypothetical protein
MTWARSSGVRSKITKIAVTGVLIGIPAAAVGVPAYAAPAFGGASNVLPAPPPADPPTIAPPPPGPPPAPAPRGEELNAENDWWVFTGDAGGGGGG